MKKFFVLLIMALTFASCVEVDPNEDPTGTITIDFYEGQFLYFNSLYEYDPYVDHVHYMLVDGPNFLTYGMDIVNVGPKTLRQVNSLPTYGWSTVLPIMPGNSYILRDWNSDGVYIRMYVVNVIENPDNPGEIIGATIKYQAPINL